MKKYLSFLILIFCLSQGIFAQESSNTNASVVVVVPMALNKVKDLNFGSVLADPLGPGSLTLSPEGVRTTTGGLFLPATTGKVRPAHFHVIGEGSYTFAITLPTSITITHTDAVNTMTIDGFTSSPSGSSSMITGYKDLKVGATLHVGADQKAGKYTSGTAFDVTVNYD